MRILIIIFSTFETRNFLQIKAKFMPKQNEYGCFPKLRFKYLKILHGCILLSVKCPFFNNVENFIADSGVLPSQILTKVYILSSTTTKIAILFFNTCNANFKFFL